MSANNMSIIQPITNTIENRLKSIFGCEFDNFLLSLQASGAVIAGSFVTQSILDETWNDSDIDIYVPIPTVESDSTVTNVPTSADVDWQLAHQNNTTTQFIEVADGIKMCYSIGGYLLTEVEQFLFDFAAMDNTDIDKQRQGNYLNVTDLYRIPGRYVECFPEALKGMREYKLQTITIQVMQIDTLVFDNKISNFIKSSFDFDICKAYYGVTYNGMAYLFCENIDAILNKTCEFRVTVDKKNTMRRLEKYKKRGFTFTNHPKQKQDHK